MNLRQINSLLPLAAMLAFGLANAAGQTPDSSGNALLKGSFRFRHVAVLYVDSNYNPTEIAATYGTIVFDGAGNYTVTATTIDNIATSGVSQPLTVTGTYAIGASGAGYLTNPLNESDPSTNIYGAVSQGVFAGSSVQSQSDATTLNDIFVAIPVATAPTNAGFTSPYQTGLLDFPGADSVSIKNALFDLTPDGKGGLGTISLNGHEANQGGSNVTQSVSGATYNFNSDGSATLTIPLPTGSTNALFTGTKTVFQSADGNFILGWTPGGYDIVFGVKALTATGTNSLSSGLYFTAALEDSPMGSGTDSYYGGTNNSGDAAGDGIVHQRFNAVGASSEDYESDDQIVLNADGTTGPNADYLGYQYIFGDGGQAFVAIGTYGSYSLVIGLHAVAFSGPGVYLNPIGVSNAASFAPATASIAPGELLVLTGTGFQSSPSAALTVAAAGQLLTTLQGVSVAIDGTNCPIFSVDSTNLMVVVPYEVASNQTGLADIQVTYNNTPSNVVQVYLTDAEPGSFSQTSNGIGYASAEHALTGQLITSSNPVQPGEYISLYLTGLGTVTPTVQDGAVGPTDTLSLADVYSSGSLAVYFNDLESGSTGNAGTISYAGLAPTLVGGLYQVNVQVPSTGLVAGDNIYVEFVTDSADVDQIQIPFGAGAVKPEAASRAKAALRSRADHIRARRQQEAQPQ
jgi:uncharacterized protein (TIGR03437 family)